MFIKCFYCLILLLPFPILFVYVTLGCVFIMYDCLVFCLVLTLLKQLFNLSVVFQCFLKAHYLCRSYGLLVLHICAMPALVLMKV